MTDEQVGEILKMFEGVWEKSKAEHVRRGLYRRLRAYDFKAVRNAFDTVITEGIPRNFVQTPWVAVIAKAKKAGGLLFRVIEREPIKLYYISCVKHDKPTMLNWRTPFFVGRPTSVPWCDIETGPAEKARIHAEETYGGNWVIERAEQPQQYADDGLRGKAAREQAEKNILAGPDCAAKRWLQARNAPKTPKPKPTPPKDALGKLSFHKQRQAKAAKPKLPSKITGDDIPF